MKVYEAGRGVQRGRQPRNGAETTINRLFHTLLGDIADPPPVPPSGDAIADTRNC